MMQSSTPDIPHSRKLTSPCFCNNLYISTADVKHFIFLQRSLFERKCEFHISVILLDKYLKVVLKGISTYISEEELKSALINYNFDVKLVKHFVPVTKPMPKCMVILSRGSNAQKSLKFIL